MSKDLQTWARAAGKLASHKPDYVIEAIRMKRSEQAITRAAKGKVKATKEPAGVRDK